MTPFLMAVAIPSFLLGPMLSMVLPMAVTSVASIAYQWVKKSNAWVDALPPQAHAFVAGAIAIVLPLLGKLVPGFEATTLGGIDLTAITTVLSLAAGQVTHKFLSGPSKS